MNIHNPSEVRAGVVVDGVMYSVDAGADVSVPDEVAAEWLKTHQFLVASDEVKEEKKAPVEEKEEVVEEVKEEKPKKKGKKSKK